MSNNYTSPENGDKSHDSTEAFSTAISFGSAPASEFNRLLHCFGPFTARFISSRVKRLIGRAGLTKADRHDLVQDFALDLIQRRPKYDPTAGKWEAFIIVVCENYYATTLKRRSAKMRSHVRESGSLNETIIDVDGERTELSSTILDSHDSCRTGRRCRSHIDAVGLANDMAQVVDRMPQQQLANRLVSAIYTRWALVNSGPFETTEFLLLAFG